jgi:hypothetical protein
VDYKKKPTAPALPFREVAVLLYLTWCRALGIGEPVSLDSMGESRRAAWEAVAAEAWALLVEGKRGDDKQRKKKAPWGSKAAPRLSRAGTPRFAPLPPKAAPRA